jgi:transcriptional regulator with XRE-family HTH domain
MTRPHRARNRFELQAAGNVRRMRRDLAAELRSGREDAGLSLHRLAAAAGVSAATVRAVEHDTVEPTLQVVARMAAALGMSLSVKLYPGPLIRDHIQAAMLEALLTTLDARWRAHPEVPVYQPVRGVIDLVLDRAPEPLVACEAQSDLRRLEQQVRWSREKSDALASGVVRGGRNAASGERSFQAEYQSKRRAVSRLLLLRSTVATRAVVARFAGVVAAAYPARSADAYAALTSQAPWPGDALPWCRVEAGRATILVHPPRGITVGR